jgi:nicotinamidase-related amidase
MSARRALLLIDFQRDFLDADGRMPIARHQVEPLIVETRRAVEAARKEGMDVIAIGNEFRPGDWLNFFRRNAAIAGSPGAAWDARLPIAGIPYFPKTQSDAFSNAELRRYLAERGTEEVILTGLQSKACVSATARGARKAGLRVRVLARAVADTSDRARKHALRKLAAIPDVCVEDGVRSECFA